jgi:hypothetical protein
MFGLEIDPDKPKNLVNFYFRKIKDLKNVQKDNNHIEEGYVDANIKLQTRWLTFIFVEM